MKKLLQLDGLRAIAVFLVLIQHFVPQGHVLLKLITWGTIGVQLFFVLSGFLITRILLDARTRIDCGAVTLGFTLRQFHIRRILRIFPVFYASLFLLAAFNIGPVRETLVWHLTYMSNVYLTIRGEMHDNITHFWSLAVELHFYMLWPFVILCTPRKYVLPIILSTVVFAPVYRFTLGALHMNPIARIWLLPASMDTLGVGALLAYFTLNEQGLGKYRGLLAKNGLWMGALGLLGISVLRMLELLPWGPEVFVMGSVLALFFFGLVDGAVRGYPGILGKFLEFAPLAYAGKISYGVYIIHHFVPEILDKSMPALGMGVPASLPLRFVLYTAVSILLAAVSWHCMEKPINGLKRHFGYRAAGA